MSRILTCEQVSDGHPDKICDQVADAIVTDCLVHDKDSRVAIECLLKDSRLIIAGELTSRHQPDYRKLVDDVLERIGRGKTESPTVLSSATRKGRTGRWRSCRRRQKL